MSIALMLFVWSEESVKSYYNTCLPLCQPIFYLRLEHIINENLIAFFFSLINTRQNKRCNSFEDAEVDRAYLEILYTGREK